MAGPVLGVDRVLLDRRVEPEAVAVVAVVERPLEGLAAALAAAPSAASAAAPGTVLAVALTLGVLATLAVLVVRVLGLRVELGGDQRVVLGAQIEILGEGGGLLLALGREAVLA